jgi:hypothetical protein
MPDLEIMRNPNSDRASVLKAVREFPGIMEWACDAFKDDYDIVMAALDTKYATDAFRHASPRLRSDRTIAATCARNDKYNQWILFVDPSLLSDREFILEVIKNRPYVFSLFTVPWTRDDVVDCVVANGEVAEYLPYEYTSDRQFALDVIAKGGHVLECLSDELRDDREVVLAQFRVECGGGCLTHASPRLQRDREMVLEAVRTAPTQLENICLYMEYTPEERERLLSDVEIVTTAVAEFGGSLRYASDACRTNRTVVMTALTSKIPANLKYVPSCLSSDPCIRLCVSANKQSVVDALLTVLETERETTDDIPYDAAFMYKHMVGRPFTADTVLSLFEFNGNGETQSMECFTPTLSTERLDALATLVNECPSEYVDMNLGSGLLRRLFENDGVLTDAVLEDMFTHYQTSTPNKWMAHGVCDWVADRLQRLGQIADALPYIDRAMRRNKGNVAFRNKCIARVDALAAKVHHPTGAYASIVHKRSFTEAFA